MEGGWRLHFQFEVSGSKSACLGNSDNHTSDDSCRILAGGQVLEISTWDGLHAFSPERQCRKGYSWRNRTRLCTFIPVHRTARLLGWVAGLYMANCTGPVEALNYVSFIFVVSWNLYAHLPKEKEKRRRKKEPPNIFNPPNLFSWYFFYACWSSACMKQCFVVVVVFIPRPVSA